MLQISPRLYAAALPKSVQVAIWSNTENLVGKKKLQFNDTLEVKVTISEPEDLLETPKT